MNKISQAEAVKLRSVLSKRIHELEEEMYRVAFVQIEAGKVMPKQKRTMIEVEKEIEEVRNDYRLLDKLMYRANIDYEINFENTNIPIVEAIELATQLRAKARKYKQFAAAEKEEYVYSYENVQLMKVATFEPEEYRVKAMECERQANRLSNLINSKNYQIQLEFDSEKYF
ncbi:hypothetical protein [Bacillus sp. B1-b2]|uniref:hypothetical protein n=1 Tax=Bacillus sp. B1-b2 TaxID=2653201 RepID=UPI0012623C83|nr:hypothetical protein [Bacillus sp. B1-b2]KAB7666905.1 hypothetical protein F9279_16730 [Bacillus sp. B1-b2]